MNHLFECAFSLNGQVALVTGGGSGLGYATAKCLSSAGANVVIAGRREGILKRACTELGRGVRYFVHDVADTNSAKPFIAQVEQECGGIDILINNAGLHCKKPIEKIGIQDFRDLMDVHLYGAFALCQAAMPGMQKKQRGSIIFISSMSALLAMTEVAVYGSAKAAVLGLMRCMAGDLSPFGIRVNAVIPGFIDTPMFHRAVDNDPPRRQKILNHTPLGAYGRPEDIGWACVYLCSEAARFVSGAALVIDGGCSVGF